MKRFDNQSFGLCGKTAISLRRNLVAPLLATLRSFGFVCTEKITQKLVVVSFGGKTNTFYLFGGKDEGSASLIQGMTLAGILFDEVALMPRSFVEQGLARCSVEGATFWFSCNPEGPEHWFYKEWIAKKEERNMYYLHFVMADNPSLSPELLARYQRQFSGTFYRRFVLGEWVAAQGRVYDFFDESFIKPSPEGSMERWAISCDYGTANPTSFGLWGLQKGIWYRVKEYYYNPRAEGRQKTDGEYAHDLSVLAGGRPIQWVIVDPSAASFITLLQSQGWPVKKAINDVVSGIRTTAQLLREGKLIICQGCEDSIREFALYCWDEKRSGDQVKKEHDHAMDEIRYFATTVVAQDTTPYVGAFYVERGRF